MSNEPESPLSFGVRPYRKGDERAVVELFNATFSRRIDEDQYRWKLIDAPRATSFAPVWLAEKGSRIIGQYAGTTMRFLVQGREHTILHGCDVMTASDCRGHGVLTALGERATRAWRDGGVAFVTGLHYGGWGSRRAHLGWRELFQASWLLYPLRLGELVTVKERMPRWVARCLDGLGRTVARMRRPPPRGKRDDVTIVPAETLGSAFDTLWDTCRTKYEALVVRDREWVKYRYVDAPGFDYRLLMAFRQDAPVGYIAFRTAREGVKTGWIADLLTTPDDRACRRALIDAALTIFVDEGCALAKTLIPNGTNMYRDFLQAGFFVGKGSFDVSIVRLADSFPYEVLSDAKRWFAMGGDFDVI